MSTSSSIAGRHECKSERTSRDTCHFQADDVNIDYLHSEAYKRKAGSFVAPWCFAGPMLGRYKKLSFPNRVVIRLAAAGLIHIIGFENSGLHLFIMKKDGFFSPGCTTIKGADLFTRWTFGNRYCQYHYGRSNGPWHHLLFTMPPCEPYIQQLCRMLNSMGAKISGVEVTD